MFLDAWVVVEFALEFSQLFGGDIVFDIYVDNDILLQIGRRFLCAYHKQHYCAQ